MKRKQTDKYLTEEYLTDEELEALIAEVEQDGLVSAPEELETNILAAVAACEQPVLRKAHRQETLDEQPHEIDRPPRDKRRELLRYSMRVVLAAAASLAILMTLPATGELSVSMAEISNSAQSMREERNVREWTERKEQAQERVRARGQEREQKWLQQQQEREQERQGRERVAGAQTGLSGMFSNQTGGIYDVLDWMTINLFK